MSENISIIYTIAKCDPRAVDDADLKVRDIKDYFNLIGRLNPDSAFKFKNILLGMARQLHHYRACKAEGGSKEYVGIKDLFFDDTFDTIAEDGNCYLVERVRHGDDVLEAPLDVWTIDTRIFKGMLSRNLYISGIAEDDILRVELKYRLRKYASIVRLGGCDDTETMEYVRKYNHYLSEFYKRSRQPDKRVLVVYLRRARYNNELVMYNQKNMATKFEFEVSAVGTLEQVKQNINDFADDMGFYAERLYQAYFAEDQYKAQRSGGNAAPEAQFRMWDRYIRIFDLYKGYIDKNRKITHGVLDAIGKIIQNEFNYYTTSEPKELRKQIKFGYSEALRLIEESTKGYIL